MLCNLKEKTTKSHVGVYELIFDNPSCTDNACIGETGIGIEERFHQHQSDVRNKNEKSAVFKHMEQTGHNIKSIEFIEYEPENGREKLRKDYTLNPWKTI